MDERRRELRFPMQVDVVVDDDARFVGGATIDLSTSGALVLLDEAPAQGAHVRLVPLVSVSLELFELRGSVVRCSPTWDGQWHVAIALSLDERQSSVLSRLFEESDWSIAMAPAA